MGNIVSNTFVKSAKTILSKLLKNLADTSFDLEPLVYKSFKKKLPKLRNAIDVYITPEETGKLKMVTPHYEGFKFQKTGLKELILALVAPYCWEQRYILT